MAKFFPDFKDIKSLKQQPTDGEYHALEMLKDLSNEYEVYYQPYINGHNPDIIVLRKNYGALIIEVKDWNLRHYQIQENNKWYLKKDYIPIKSPIEQVKAYKNDLYNLSIPSMLFKKIDNEKIYGLIQIAIYFHNATSHTIKENNIKTDKWCPIYGSNNFTLKNISEYSLRKYPNKLFDDDIYTEFQRLLKPSLHTLEQAQEVKLSPKQKALAQSRAKQQKIRGVAGSGKTVVLAKRAVNSHIRHGEEVLILTFNITLRNYIHDNLNRVRENFSWKFFHINHYHGFVASVANNNNIKVNSMSDYDNEKIFESVKDKLPKYKAIFIDEIQDYKKSWVKIIKKYFLADDGEFLALGDEKQNIYDITMESDKKPYTGIGGAWLKLEQSYRMSNKILNLAESFQEYFFKNKYELDKAMPKQQTLDFDESIIEYFKLDDNMTLFDLASKINDKIKSDSIQPQDVCVIAQSNALLRGLDYEIRQITKQKTYTTFETQEMYNYLLKKNLTEDVFRSKIRAIQRNKRFNFWMNSAGLKLSTISSFKGWEIDTLFLIIDGESKHESNEKIYTALTRCRNRLIILNLNYSEYDTFFVNNIKPNRPIASISKSNNKSFSISSNQTKQNKNQVKNKVTIRETIQKDNLSNFSYNFNKLKNNGKFRILILGEIASEKNKYKESLNNHFSKFSIRANEWDIDFWNNKKIKQTDLKSLRKGQSNYKLIVTAQIYHHSSRGNSKQNLLIELASGMQYIDVKIGCKPQNLLTIDNFIDKIDEYISEQY